MVAPLIIWGGVALFGAAGWAFKEGGEAAEAATTLAKWGTVAGGVYVSYRALQSAGAIK
jgi:hypothetical protein